MADQTYDKATNTATFPSRSIGTIRCPVCDKPQMANRNACYSCSCKFVYTDETDSEKSVSTV